MVRVVKIGKSIELCGGTHVANTKEIENFAIYTCESKGSNVYRIEATTGSRSEMALYEAIKPYNDEMVKLLMKAKNILDKAKNEAIKLEFDVDIDNSKPSSYKDIIFNRNELSYVQQEVKTLEKKYFELKEKQDLANLDIYKEHVKNYNGTLGIVMEVKDKDNNILKAVSDTLVEIMNPGFVFFANVKGEDSVNFIVRSNCSVNAGLIAKEASMMANGNGGGSPTFAQGGGKDASKVREVLENVENSLRHE